MPKEENGQQNAYYCAWRFRWDVPCSKYLSDRARASKAVTPMLWHAVLGDEDDEQEAIHAHRRAEASTHSRQMCRLSSEPDAPWGMDAGGAGEAEARARASSAARLLKLSLAESTKERLAKLAPAEHTKARLAKLAHTSCLTEHTRARLTQLALAEHNFPQNGDVGFAQGAALAVLHTRGLRICLE